MRRFDFTPSGFGADDKGRYVEAVEAEAELATLRARVEELEIANAQLCDADALAQFFNEALLLDQDAIRDLLGTRAICNSLALPNHPTIQVGREHDGCFTVGFIGLLNGLLVPTGNVIASLHEIDESGRLGRILGFRSIPFSQVTFNDTSASCPDGEGKETR